MMIIITVTAAAVKVGEITSSDEYRPQQTLMVHRPYIAGQLADEW